MRSRRPQQAARDEKRDESWTHPPGGRELKEASGKLSPHFFADPFHRAAALQVPYRELEVTPHDMTADFDGSHGVRHGWRGDKG
jgi:hypothetical protein